MYITLCTSRAYLFGTNYMHKKMCGACIGDAFCVIFILNIIRNIFILTMPGLVYYAHNIV